MHDPIGTPALWAGFLAIVGVLLALDLGVFHRKAHAVGFREAAAWSTVWVAVSLAFNSWIWLSFGNEPGLEFLTGYLVEKALSVDNIFVFVVIFGYFAVPAAYQHRVLFWGILGALVLRGIFIFAGGAFLDRFHWAVYVFGAVLLFTGFRLLREQGEHYEPGKNPVVRLFRRFVPTTDRYHGEHFLVREGGRRLATPLLVALVAVEATDVVFAVDSIPAIFAITRDRFIVFTSNIFAILGLRAMYFLLAGIIDRFHHLKVGLALVLIFIGAKMTFSDFWKPPIELSLAVIAALIGGSIVTSLIVPPRPTKRRRPSPPAATPDDANPAIAATERRRGRAPVGHTLRRMARRGGKQQAPFTLGPQGPRRINGACRFPKDSSPALLLRRRVRPTSTRQPRSPSAVWTVLVDELGRGVPRAGVKAQGANLSEIGERRLFCEGRKNRA